jgi:hypothetical protein
MSAAYTIPGSPASYWLATLTHTVDITPKNTHIAIVGTVVYRRAEADGDLHFDLQDSSGAKITCEIDPQNPLQMPALGQQVRAYGVYRTDPDHGGWPEVHPVDYWEDASVVPVAAA